MKALNRDSCDSPDRPQSPAARSRRWRIRMQEQQDLQQAVNEAGTSSHRSDAFARSVSEKISQRHADQGNRSRAGEGRDRNKDDAAPSSTANGCWPPRPTTCWCSTACRARRDRAWRQGERGTSARARPNRFQEIVEKLPEASGLGAAKSDGGARPRRRAGACSINRAPNPRWAILTRRRSWRRSLISQISVRGIGARVGRGAGARWDSTSRR